MEEEKISNLRRSHRIKNKYKMFGGDPEIKQEPPTFFQRDSQWVLAWQSESKNTVNQNVTPGMDYYKLFGVVFTKEVKEGKTFYISDTKTIIIDNDSRKEVKQDGQRKRKKEEIIKEEVIDEESSESEISWISKFQEFCEVEFPDNPVLGM